jgi:hypothetical protein
MAHNNNPVGQNAESYLLAFAIINMIKRQSDTVISRLNNARIAWTIAKSRDEIPIDNLDAIQLDTEFKDIRNRYDPIIEENSNYADRRAEIEAAIDDAIDGMFILIFEFKLVSGKTMQEVEMGGYGSAGGDINI